MLFQLHLRLSEEDYLAFNHFHSFESAPGKKQLHRSRLIYLLTVAALSVPVLLSGRTAFSVAYVLLVTVFSLVYMACFKKVLTWNINSRIKRLKKIGKLLFDPDATLEFYDDKLVEITESKRIEQTYDVLERICVVGDCYLFLYNSSVSAYILPTAQVKAQTDLQALLAFLSEKCPHVEHY